MADNSLPYRAKEVSKRIKDLEKRNKEQHENFMKQMEVAQRDYEELTEHYELMNPRDVKAMLEGSRERHQRLAEAIREHEKRETELISALDEQNMINLEATIEGTKLLFEAVKQQATFSVAALAGVAAITAGILPGHLSAVWLLWATITILLLTIILSLILLYAEAGHIYLSLSTGERMSRTVPLEKIRTALYVSAFGLPISLIAFVIFSVINLF